MTSLRTLLLAIALLISAAAPVWAGVEQLGEEEFRKLAGELAPKVNLFRDAWAQNPQAEFYGGTTRDYLYWLKGNFREAGSPADAQRVATKLRALTVIDVKDFIFGESDVDILSKAPLDLEASRYGVRKVDTVSPALLDPSSELGFNERNQGYAPAEKVRLGRKGILPNPDLGDGAREIYRGKLTVRFASPEQFAKTKYAREGLNHPALLALRYVRLLASNYFHDHGAGVVDQETLLESLDKRSAESAKRVIQEAHLKGELTPFLKDHRFRTWINGTIQKTFHSYSSPAAAHALMREFGIDKLVDRYSETMEPINQYLFAKRRDEKAVASALRQAGVKENDLYLPAAQAFPDGYLYHGTKTEKAFRGILFQGALPSTSGTAGDGLYGVPDHNLSFAERWAGNKELAVKIPVRPDAKVIDLTRGPGAVLWQAFPKQDYTLFAETYGADILRYPYDSEAFVVKNSGVLGRAEGVYRQLQSLGQLAESIRRVPSMEALQQMLPPGEEGEEARALIAEEYGRRLQKEQNVPKLIRMLRDPNLPEEFRPKVARRLLPELSAQSDVTLTLDTLAAINDPKDPQAIATAKKMRLDPAAADLLIHAKSTTAEQIQAFINYYLPSRPTPEAMETLRKITNLHRPQYESALARFVFGYKAWYTVDPDLTMAFLRNLKDPEVFEEMVDWLSEDGFWQKQPERLKEIMTSPELPLPHKLVVFDNYLNLFPQAWRHHADLFDKLLYPQGPFGDPQSEPEILKKLAEAFSKDKFPKTAERLLSLDTAVRFDSKASLAWEKISRLYFDPDSSWQNDPLIKKILRGEEFDREILSAAWIFEQLGQFGKEAKKKKMPPLELLTALHGLNADVEGGQNAVKHSGLKFADFLAAVEHRTDHDDLFTSFLLVGKTGPQERAALHKIMQRADEDMMEHLAVEILSDPLWHNRHPDIVDEFFARPESKIVNEATIQKLEKLGFWAKHPASVKAVVRTGTPDAKKAILERHLYRNWEGHFELFLEFLPPDDAPTYVAQEALRYLRDIVRAKGLEKRPEILLELRRAYRRFDPSSLNDIDQLLSAGSDLMKTPLLRELSVGGRTDPWSLAEQWEKKRSALYPQSSCQRLFAKTARD